VYSNPAKSVFLITGSEGLIGDRLVRAFALDFDVASFDIARPHKRPDLQDFIHCDLTSDESVAGALEELRRRHGHRIASVVHLAAYYDFSGEPSRLYNDLTIEGTRRLLRGLQSFEVEQFIFASTMLVMKPSEEGERITEQSPTQAEWDYPQSKLATERVIHEERGNIKTVVLRISGVYDEDCNSIPLAQQITRIYEKKFEALAYPGDLDHGQPYVHLDDLTECFRLVTEKRRELGDEEVFLVAEPHLLSYGELQETIGNLLYRHEWPTFRIPKVVAKAGAWIKEKLDDDYFIKPWMIDIADQHYPISIGKARTVLGWQPRRRLRDVLPEMLGRLTHEPERWYQRNGLEVPEDLLKERIRG
jgi:nucleoside-diphosphate-sugar epimerase